MNEGASRVDHYHHAEEPSNRIETKLTRYQKGDYGWEIRLSAEEPQWVVERLKATDDLLRHHFSPEKEG